jgi:hypothetical protein
VPPAAARAISPVADLPGAGEVGRREEQLNRSGRSIVEFTSRRRVLRAALPAIVLLLAAGTASAEKYEGMVVTFDKPVEAVHKAAVDALTVVGVEIKKDEATLVEGKRKNKMGAFVGSGGEVLSVALTAVDGGKTEAKIRTTKTFVGRAGQKVWDQQVADEMNKSLGLAATSAPAAATTAQ